MDAYNALCTEAAERLRGLLGASSRGSTCCWHKPFTKVLDESNAPFFKWFADGELNASYNCLDRHSKTQPRQDRDHLRGRQRQGHQDHLQGAAIAASASSPTRLKAQGIKKGDRVIIYMPMTIEGVVAMQACARIGADAFGRVRRLLREEPAGAHHRCRRRHAVLTPTGSSAAARRFRSRPSSTRRWRWADATSCKSVWSSTSAPVASARWRGRDVWLDDAIKGQPIDVRAGVGQRRTSAVHPLHVGFDRQAKGRAALHRRLSADGDPHHEVDVRLSSRRTSSGARPTWAGSPGTRTSPTGRSPAARPRSCSKACRPIRTPAASGR